MSFRKDFVWGAAAASYQVEGAAFEDGKGLSVWDTFCKTPDKVYGGQTGEVACDHYHRWKEDVDIMAGIGLKAYRMSVSWPRVIPAGTGKVNAKGLAFYDRLVDSLLENGIEPWVTMFHWDYPYELYQRGGWLNRDSSDWFAEYAKVLVDKLSDRVTHWMTLNEPQCFVCLGHSGGEHAPGLKLGLTDVITAGHNSLLAHGKACQVIRARSKQKALIGAAPVGSVRIPFSDSKADIAAAKQHMFELRDKGIWSLSWFSDPMILGHYPADHLELMKEEMPEFPAGDMKIIKQKLDFYGTNIYQGHRVKAVAGGKPKMLPNEPGCAMTTMEWNLSPDALYWGAKFLYERYRLPIVVTENGMGGCDWVHLDGKVHDPQRIDYLGRYLASFRRASEEGIPCLGYFYWSIMDNFEWAQGYKRRFGLVHVDYQTQKRTLKDSALWYAEVIKSNGAII